MLSFNDAADSGTADGRKDPQLRGDVRGMKLVVTLQLDPSGSQRALVALGADGCDPEIRVAVVPDLLAALDEVPAVLAAAQARWQTQRRYAPPPRSASIGRMAARTHAAPVPPAAPPMPPSAPAPDANSEQSASEGALSTTVPVPSPPEITQSGRSSTPQLALFN